jgi:hypothetical protein
VVNWLLPQPGRLDDDPQVLHQLGLPYELGQRARPETRLFDLLAAAGRNRRHQPGVRVTRPTKTVPDPDPDPVGVVSRRQHLAARSRAHEHTRDIRLQPWGRPQL